MNKVRFSAGSLGYLSAVLICIPLLVGCPGGNADSAHLAGKVTIGGEPLPSDADTYIYFVPQAQGGRGQAARAKIENGRYDAPEAPVGQVHVSISANKSMGRITDERGSYEDIQSVLPPGAKNMQTITVDGDNTDLNFDM